MFTRTLVASALLAGLAFTSPAFAGECPAGQMRADATKPSTAAAKAVTDMVLAQIDLAGEKLALNGHMMRVRKLEVQPGGVVPWHSHGDRPALIYVAEGEIHEFASNCAAPIVHKAGDLRRETSEVSHWWKNLGDTTVILLVADVLHDRTDHNM